jgi:hypothetical protein
LEDDGAAMVGHGVQRVHRRPASEGNTNVTTTLNDHDGPVPERPIDPIDGAAELVDRADDQPLVAAVADFAHHELAPRALAYDEGVVPGHVVGSLRDLGALNHLAPASHGGAEVDRSADRRLHEHLAYGCLNTWLIWAQHAPIVGRIARELAEGRDVGPRAHRVLRGDDLAGAGISDVRRFPNGHLSAEPVAGGWRFRGTVSWVSGWGLNEVLLLAAVDAATSRVVTALVPVSDRTIAAPLSLKAVTGSRTVRVRIDDVTVPDADVVAVDTLAAWHANDRDETSDARPHVFGLTARILDELRGEPHAADVVRRWQPRITEIRTRAYALAEESKRRGAPHHRVEERVAIKVSSTEALATVSQALLIARAGRGLTGDDTAQLHARSALFLLVQGQTAAVRAAQLDRIAGRPAVGLEQS